MVDPARWMMWKLLHPEVWTSDVLVQRIKPWICLGSQPALSWSKPCAWEVLMGRPGEMMATNPGAGEDTSTCSQHCERSRETFLGDFEAVPSGWGEERVRKAVSSLGFWGSAVGTTILLKQSRALKPCACWTCFPFERRTGSARNPEPAGCRWLQ